MIDTRAPSPHTKTKRENPLSFAAFLCTTLWLFISTSAHAVNVNDAKEAEQERLRTLSIYKKLDEMDGEKGIYITQDFIMTELPRLMDERYNAGSNDQLRAIFVWMRDWADRGRNPAYGFLYAEHLHTILLNKNNNLQPLQAEDVARQALQNYFLSFQLMREDMARCGGESRTYIGNASFIPIIARFKSYKEIFDTMPAHKKRLIIRYVLEKSDTFKDRIPRVDFCKKTMDDNAPELIANDAWLEIREKYRAEFRQKLFPPEE